MSEDLDLVDITNTVKAATQRIAELELQLADAKEREKRYREALEKLVQVSEGSAGCPKCEGYPNGPHEHLSDCAEGMGIAALAPKEHTP